jgi:hypothetical protein
MSTLPNSLSDRMNANIAFQIKLYCREQEKLLRGTSTSKWGIFILPSPQSKLNQEAPNSLKMKRDSVPSQLYTHKIFLKFSQKPYITPAIQIENDLVYLIILMLVVNNQKKMLNAVQGHCSTVRWLNTVIILATGNLKSEGGRP